MVRAPCARAAAAGRWAFGAGRLATAAHGPPAMGPRPAGARGAARTRAAGAATEAGGARQGARAGPPAAGGGAGGEGQAMGKVDVSPPRGTRDFFPEDKRFQNWLFGKFRAVSGAFCFEEVDFPVVESEALYVRKAGEEITGQLYNFEDKGGRRLALRPELTPSLARLVLQKGKALTLPAKWFAIGQCWRYERMTRGRRREHYQWNMDIVGADGVEAEAELLAAVVQFFQSVGLTAADVGIKLSSRKVLQEICARQGVPDAQFGAVCVVVDKIEKLPRAEVERELGALGLPAEAIAGVLSALSLSSLAELGALVGEGSDAIRDLERLFALAEGYGYADWVTFDASIVRGLAYYTGVVFEGFDRSGQLRAICGGGRYDKLISTFGGDDVSCVGFGFGDAVIVELLQEKGLLPELTHRVQDVVMVEDAALAPAAAAAAATLRRGGRQVDLLLEKKKMKWIFKHCDRVQAERLVKVTADDGTVTVRDLSARSDEVVQIADLEPAAAT